MNVLLKSDVEGVLEHIATTNHSHDQDQISHTVISLITQEVQHTRQRLDGVDFEQELHAVLFRAWQQSTGSYRPYAKFHHRNGLKTSEYYELLNNFDLWKQLARTLYALAPELAINILETLREMCSNGDNDDAYIAIYLTICSNLPVHLRIEKCETIVSTFLRSAFNSSVVFPFLNLLNSLFVDMKTGLPESERSKDILRIVLKLLMQLDESTIDDGRIKLRHQSTQKLFWMRLKRYISSDDSRLAIIGKRCDEELQKYKARFDNAHSVSLTLQDSYRFSDFKLTEPSSEHHPLSTHHSAFVRIFKLIDKNCSFNSYNVDDLQELGGNNGTYTRANDQQAQYLFDFGNQSTLEYYVQDCLYRIHQCLPGWKSFLELAVDYQDVIFSHIEPGSQKYDAICVAIASEKLYWRFFERLQYIVEIYQQTQDLIGNTQIQALSKALMTVFNSIRDLTEKFNFRNHIYCSSRTEYSESGDILFESIILWSQPTIMAYINELKIVCNKIVEDNESGAVDEISEEYTNRFVIDKLCSISVIMPYAVLSSLVTDCIHNRGQTSAIQHILQMSGGICSLKTKTENAGLLVKVLSSHEVIRLMDTPSARRNYVELVCQWAKIDTISTASQNLESVQPLLDLVQYYRFCLIPELSKAAKRIFTYTKALPAYIQLLSTTLGMHLDTGNQNSDSTAAELNTIHLQNHESIHVPEHRTADFIKCVNWIQILTDLTTLLSTRAKLLDHSDNDKDLAPLHLRFADWEAFIFALEALVAISENYSDSYVQTQKRSNEAREAPLTLTDMEQSVHTLFEKFSSFNWDLQLRLYPFFTNVAQRLSVEPPSVTVPNDLMEFLKGFNGLVVSDDSQSDDSNKWTELMVACKSASHVHDVVIKNLSHMAMYTTGKLHPYRSINFATGMYQALLPSKTLSVLSEYKKLLVGFLGKVYDLPDIPKLMRNHDYENEHLNRMVKELEHEDLRVLHTIIYSKLLLGTSTLLSKYPDHSEGNTPPFSNREYDNNHAAYFVASIMRVIQSLRNWSEILVGSRLKIDELQRQPFSDYLRQVMPELQHLPEGIPSHSHHDDIKDITKSDALENAINMYISMSNEQQARQQNTTMIQDNNIHQPRELMFPPESPTLISSVNLSVVTLNLLAHAKAMIQDEKLKEIIWILMSQIIEGIYNDPYRKRLIQAARKAGKATIKNWKKRTDNHKYIIRCRPLLNFDQHALTQDTLEMLDSEQERRIILVKLDMSGSSNAKAPAYYF